MKKILLLLAVLLNSHLQASQPTTQDIIQLPRGLSCSVGLNKVMPKEVLLLISTFIFGKIEEKEFSLATKGIGKLVENQESLYDFLWLPYHQSASPPTQLLSRQEIFPWFYEWWDSDRNSHVDEVLWLLTKKTCLYAITSYDNDQLFEVSCLGKFCFITPYKLPKNRSFVYLNHHNNGIEYDYIISDNKTYYKKLKESVSPWKKNYSSKLVRCTIIEQQIASEEVAENEEGHTVSDEEVVSGGEEEEVEDEEELTIYD